MLNKKVKVLSGRNKNEIGIVTKISRDNKFFYIDFQRNLYINEGFGSFDTYSDAYWVNISEVQKLS